MRQRMGISHIWPQNYENWADGFLGGNGTLGIIVLGNPLDEIIILNHRRFNIAATHSRSFSKVRDEDLKAIRKACAAGDFKRANDLADQTHGWQDGGEGNRHPGGRLKIKMEEAGAVREYRRSCDYRTGEICVQWSDDRGAWDRRIFVSRKDNVAVQRLTGPDNQKFSCELQLGTEEGMHLPEGMTFFRRVTPEYLKLRAVYPQPDLTGMAGYECVIKVIVRGPAARMEVAGDVLHISDAQEVLLLTGIAHYEKECRTEWDKELLYKRLSALKQDYEQLLEKHLPLHQTIYDRVCLDLKASEKERLKSNETLLQEQKSSPVLLPALYERLFDAGRYHYLCASGENAVPDLLGVWTGDCNVGWNGYYHLDANLNLQTAGAITGNMAEMMEGYFKLNEAWADDFEINAQKLLGCRGLLACGNSPGPSSGLISALNYAYPYHYVTGEEAWLLYPFWEYYQVTGDVGFLKNRLYPLLRKLGDFYEDFLVETDENGKYIFAGSISPENQPEGLGLSLVNNSAFDIAGAKFGLETLVKVCELLGTEDETSGGVSRWKRILQKLPEYRINEDGALAEWAWEGLKDHYNHRHSSGLICVYPYQEITPEKDGLLYQAACQAHAKRNEYNYEDAGHGLLHAALIAARLKNADSVMNKLLRLGKEDFYYTGLSTAHYPEGKVFCTDVALTLPAICTEMLLYSDESTLEFLPALPDCLPAGEITGLLGRNRICVERLTWDLESGKICAQLTSAVEQKITILCRRGIQTLVTAAETEASQFGKIGRQIYLEALKTTELEIFLYSLHRGDSFE